MSDFEKHADKVRKLVTLAARSTDAPEKATAARAASRYLDKYPTPIRWLVPAGTPVRVIPDLATRNGLAKVPTKAVIRSTARGANWFFEAQRVKGDEANEALALGWLFFKRHGYAVFVDAGNVEVHL